MKKTSIVIIAIVVLVLLYGWSTYNRLVTGRENADNQWAQVETQYQRRFDLIPNLVESVKGIMKQEQEVFKAIADARTRYSGASSVDAKAAAATQVEGALGRLLVVMENYPQLKANENFLQLQEELTGTENKIAYSRQHYNDMVMIFNTKIEVFPNNMFVNMFNFKREDLFEAAEEEKKNVKVQF